MFFRTRNVFILSTRIGCLSNELTPFFSPTNRFWSFLIASTMTMIEISHHFIPQLSISDLPLDSDMHFQAGSKYMVSQYYNVVSIFWVSLHEEASDANMNRILGMLHCLQGSTLPLLSNTTNRNNSNHDASDIINSFKNNTNIILRRFCSNRKNKFRIHNAHW